MVSAQTILILGGIALFVFAGGVGLSKTAFGQVKTDFKSITGGISSRVKGITNNQKDFSNNPSDRAGELIV
ncbi:MAG: hypothetical protein IIB81_00485 [Nanoarchaeota archaeon]|nr:hypothetical protein [Nanoarchaeota archaeon]